MDIYQIANNESNQTKINNLRKNYFLNLKYKENKIRPTRTTPTNILKY